MPYNKGGPVTDYKMDVGPGWHSLLNELHKELAVINPDYQTVQVKEKFGQLRVYIGGTPIQADIMGGSTGVVNVRIKDTATKDNWRKLQDIVDKYEAMSASVCENCGQPGKLDTSHYWRKTLCDSCVVARNERWKV